MYRSGLSVLNHESKRLEHAVRTIGQRDFSLSVLNHESKRLELIITGIMPGLVLAFQYSTTSRNGWNYSSYKDSPSSPNLSVLNHESKRLEPAISERSVERKNIFQYSTTSRNGWNSSNGEC